MFTVTKFIPSLFGHSSVKKLVAGMIQENPLLRIVDLHTYFYLEGGIARAVDGIDLLLGRGMTLGLVGESGCGKTVTGLSILRLVPVPPARIDRGQIIFEGTDLLKLEREEIRDIRGNQIAMIFQEPMSSMNPAFSVGFQVAEVIRRHQKVSKKKALDLVVEIFQKVGISDPERRIEEYPHQLSGGMIQRVMIAMALSCNPRLVIADEPTTALDVTIQAQILDIMRRLKEETATSVLLITHDLGVIAEMADSVAVMYTGKIMEYSGNEDFFERPLHPYTLGLMNSIPRIDTPVPEDRLLQAIPGIVPSLLKLPHGCSFRDRCDTSGDICGKKAPPLFEVRAGHFVRCWQYEQ